MEEFDPGTDGWLENLAEKLGEEDANQESNCLNTFEEYMQKNDTLCGRRVEVKKVADVGRRRALTGKLNEGSVGACPGFDTKRDFTHKYAYTMNIKANQEDQPYRVDQWVQRDNKETVGALAFPKCVVVTGQEGSQWIRVHDGGLNSLNIKDWDDLFSKREGEILAPLRNIVASIRRYMGNYIADADRLTRIDRETEPAKYRQAEESAKKRLLTVIGYIGLLNLLFVLSVLTYSLDKIFDDAEDLAVQFVEVFGKADDAGFTNLHFAQPQAILDLMNNEDWYQGANKEQIDDVIRTSFSLFRNQILDTFKAYIKPCDNADKPDYEPADFWRVMQGKVDLVKWARCFPGRVAKKKRVLEVAEEEEEVEEEVEGLAPTLEEQERQMEELPQEQRERLVRRRSSAASKEIDQRDRDLYQQAAAGAKSLALLQMAKQWLQSCDPPTATIRGQWEQALSLDQLKPTECFYVKTGKFAVLKGLKFPSPINPYTSFFSKRVASTMGFLNYTELWQWSRFVAVSLLLRHIEKLFVGQGKLIFPWNMADTKTAGIPKGPFADALSALSRKQNQDTDFLIALLDFDAKDLNTYMAFSRRDAIDWRNRFANSFYCGVGNQFLTLLPATRYWQVEAQQGNGKDLFLIYLYSILWNWASSIEFYNDWKAIFPRGEGYTGSFPSKDTINIWLVQQEVSSLVGYCTEYLGCLVPKYPQGSQFNRNYTGQFSKPERAEAWQLNRQGFETNQAAPLVLARPWPSLEDISVVLDHFTVEVWKGPSSSIIAKSLQNTYSPLCPSVVLEEGEEVMEAEEIPPDEPISPFPSPPQQPREAKRKAERSPEEEKPVLKKVPLTFQDNAMGYLLARLKVNPPTFPVGLSSGFVHPRGGVGENWEVARLVEAGHANPYQQAKLKDYNQLVDGFRQRVSPDEVARGFESMVQMAQAQKGSALDLNLPNLELLRQIYALALEKSKILILRVGTEAYLEWKRRGIKLRARDIYVLCGKTKQRRAQPVVNAELAKELVAGHVEQGETVYFAVAKDTGALLGFIDVADYRQTILTWREFPERSKYFRLDTNPQALQQQKDMQGYPQFRPDDRILGAQTNTLGNRLAASLEIAFLCASNARQVKGIGAILTVHALLENIQKGYYGVLLEAASTVEKKPFPTQQGNIDLDKFGKKIKSNSFLISYYHRFFQFERSFPIDNSLYGRTPRFPPPPMTATDNRLWFYDQTFAAAPTNGFVYQLKSPLDLTEKISIGGEEQSGADLLPENALMYRPYPTLEQMISYVGQIGSLMTPTQRME